jgi:CO dehydrogenase/acetyl-CoA synthase beta subunit
MESKELGFTLIECISDNYRENVEEQLNHVVERLRSKFVSYTEEDMHHFLMKIPIGKSFLAIIYR